MAAVILQFGARTEAARSAMQQLTTSVQSNTAVIAKSFATAALATAASNSSMTSSLGASASAALKFVIQYQALIRSLAIVSLGIANASDNLRDLVSIGEKANNVKLSPETFQAFVREAERARIATKEAEAALATFNRANKEGFDASNQVNPKVDSPLGKLLQELVLVQQQLSNSPALDRFLNAEDQNAKLRATIDLIRELQRAQQDLAANKVAETAFGANGERFAEQIRQGKFELEQITAEGKAAGLIFDNELVARAVDLRNRLEAAGREISDNMTPLLRGSVTIALELSSAFVGAAEAAASVARAVTGITSAIGAAQSAAISLVKALGTAANAARAAAGGGNYNLSAEDVPEVENQIAELSRQIAGIRERTAPSRRDAPNIELDRLIAERANLENRLKTAPARPIQGPEAPQPESPKSVIVQQPPTRPPNLGQNSRGRSGGGGLDETDKRLREIETFIKALEKSNRVLEAEVATFGKSNAEREKAIALAKIGSDLTDAQRQKIEQVAEATGKLRDKQKELEDQQRRTAEAARFMGDAITDALDDLIVRGEKAADVGRKLLQSFASASLRGLLTGQGPFGIGGGGVFGLLGGLFNFGGARAAGGPVSAGSAYLVGEKGPELFVPGISGAIIPNGGRSGGGSAGGAAAPAVEARVYITAAPDLPAMIRTEARGVAVEVTRAGIDANNARLPQMLAQRDAR